MTHARIKCHKHFYSERNVTFSLAFFLFCRSARKSEIILRRVGHTIFMPECGDGQAEFNHRILLINKLPFLQFLQFGFALNKVIT